MCWVEIHYMYYVLFREHSTNAVITQKWRKSTASKLTFCFVHENRSWQSLTFFSHKKPQSIKEHLRNAPESWLCAFSLDCCNSLFIGLSKWNLQKTTEFSSPWLQFVCFNIWLDFSAWIVAMAFISKLDWIWNVGLQGQTIATVQLNLLFTLLLCFFKDLKLLWVKKIFQLCVFEKMLVLVLVTIWISTQDDDVFHQEGLLPAVVCPSDCSGRRMLWKATGISASFLCSIFSLVFSAIEIKYDLYIELFVYRMICI